MGYDGSLKFDTEIDEKGFNSGVGKLGKIAQTGLGVLTGNLMTSAIKNIGNLATAGLEYNASIEQYKTSFEVMTGSAKKATDIVENLKKVGAETPFELNNLAETTQLLMNYGLTADESMDKMMMLGDISQGSADKMSRIATAYGQMSSAGKVQLQDIKQMIEAGFNPLQEISESTGESMDSLYKRISDGKISVEEITASMERATSEGGKYFQSMEKQSQTFNGLISTLKDNAMQLLGEVVKPISDGMTETLLPAAISTTEQLMAGFKEKGIVGMLQAGQDIFSNFVNGAMSKAPEMISTGMDIATNILTGIVNEFPNVVENGRKLITNVVDGILQNLPMIVKKGGELVTEFTSAVLKSLPKVLQSGVKLILSIVNGIINNLPSIVSAAVKAVAKFISTIGSKLPQIIQTGIQILGKLGVGLIQAIPNLISKIPRIISSIKKAFTSVDWWSIGKNIISGIGKGIAGAAKSLVKAAVKAAKDAVKAVKRWLGIKSPSRRMRDEVGKHMATGMGIGFEQNIPTDEMNKSLEEAVAGLQRTSFEVSSQPAKSVDSVIMRGKHADGADNTNESVPIHIHNTFEVDGTPLVKKTTKAVIQKVSNDQKARDMVKGR